MTTPAHSDVWSGDGDIPICLACGDRPSAVFTSLRVHDADVPGVFYLCEPCYVSFAESVLGWQGAYHGTPNILVISHPTDDWLDAFAKAQDDAE